MNVLHLHLTDSESWPLQMTTYPGITDAGAYSKKETYSIADMKALIEYAQLKGIVIIPEIDLPAHARTWSNHEDLKDIDACRDQPLSEWTKNCLEPPCGQLDVTMDKTYNVVYGVL